MIKSESLPPPRSFISSEDDDGVDCDLLHLPAFSREVDINGDRALLVTWGDDATNDAKQTSDTTATSDQLMRSIVAELLVVSELRLLWWRVW